VAGEATLARFRGVGVASWLEVEAVAPAISVALGDGGHSMRLGWWRNRRREEDRWGNIGIGSGLTS
jgi:hypothetical protein